MSVYDLFRGFFGFRGEPRPRDPFFGGITRDAEDDDEDDDDDDGGPSSSFGARGFDGFGFPFGPGGGTRFHDGFGFEELFRDFNDLFSEMGAVGLPSQPFEFPGVDPPPPADPSPRKRGTLRDSMLKYPDSRDRGPEDGGIPPAREERPWRPFQGLQESPPAPADIPREDGDLDSRVKSEGLETILPPAQPRSYFKSVSVTKVVAPDGTIEERRTVRDSQGREETVVTRRSGGEPVQDGGRLGGAGSRHGEDLSDSSSILDTFFRHWFSSR